MTLWKAIIGGKQPVGRWETHMYLRNDSLSSAFVYSQVVNWWGAWWGGNGMGVSGIGHFIAATVNVDRTVLYTLDPDTGRAVERIEASGSPVPGTSTNTCGPGQNCAVIELRADATRNGIGRMHTPPLDYQRYGQGHLSESDNEVIRDATQYAFSTFHSNGIVPQLFNRRTLEARAVQSFFVPDSVGNLSRRARKYHYTEVTGSV
jgi:hypothetical protein